VNNVGLLTYLVFLPTVAGALILAGADSMYARRLALAVTAAELVLSLFLFRICTAEGHNVGRWLMSERHDWIPRYGIGYILGLDGISLVLVILTASLFVLAVGVSWRSVERNVVSFHAVLLFMETGVMGVFLSADLFLFYLFWEVMLVPMFFLIGIWGHGRRIYSAVSVIGLYLAHGSITGIYTFELDQLIGTHLEYGMSLWLFAGFLAGFAVKVPMFPVHTWLPDAHTDAPTAGSVILAGLMLKTGTYGLLRFGFPLFPQAALAFLPLIFTLSVAGIFYAAWIAYAQDDIKRLVAYSSVSHLAYVVLGIAAWNEVSLAGSVMQMVNHGITTGALFIMVGMLDERAHTRRLDQFGGLWTKAPVMSAFFLLFVLSSLGLPGLNNFAGELLIIVGLFRAHPYIAAAALAGLVAGLAYLLRLTQKLLFGPEGPSVAGHGFPDVTGRELAVLIPLAVAVVVIGVHPAFLLDIISQPVKGLMDAAVNLHMAGGAP